MSRLEKIRNKNIPRVVHERTREEKPPTRRPLLALSLIFLIFCGLFYLLFLSGAFNVKEIRVSGYQNKKLASEIIESHLDSSLIKKSIFFLKTKKIEEAIRGDTAVKEVDVKLKYPDKVIVKIVEVKPSIIWITEGESFEIDDRGYVVGKNEKKDLPKVYDLLNIKVSLGERVASPTFVNYIIELNDNFEKITGVGVGKIIIYDILSDVRVKSTSSWTAYFNASKDPVSQLKNLTRVLSEVSNKSKKKLDYIDMRLETRIFYK